MAPERTHITPQMRDVVGLELRRSTSFPITDSDIRRWAIAVYYPEPAPRLFWDAELRRGHGARRDRRPRGLQPVRLAHPDRGRRGVRRPRAPAGSCRRRRRSGSSRRRRTSLINGGTEVDYGVRMRPGDVITSVTRLAGYSEREGRLGLMLFTTSEDTWTNQRGETVKTSRNTLIRY